MYEICAQAGVRCERQGRCEMYIHRGRETYRLRDISGKQMPEAWR